jgi:hypothetical protein
MRLKLAGWNDRPAVSAHPRRHRSRQRRLAVHPLVIHARRVLVCAVGCRVVSSYYLPSCEQFPYLSLEPTQSSLSSFELSPPSPTRRSPPNYLHLLLSKSRASFSTPSCLFITHISISQHTTTYDASQSVSSTDSDANIPVAIDLLADTYPSPVTAISSFVVSRSHPTAFGFSTTETATKSRDIFCRVLPQADRGQPGGCR